MLMAGLRPQARRGRPLLNFTNSIDRLSVVVVAHGQTIWAPRPSARVVHERLTPARTMRSAGRLVAAKALTAFGLICCVEGTLRDHDPGIVMAAERLPEIAARRARRRPCRTAQNRRHASRAVARNHLEAGHLEGVVRAAGLRRLRVWNAGGCSVRATQVLETASELDLVTECVLNSIDCEVVKE